MAADGQAMPNRAAVGEGTVWVVHVVPELVVARRSPPPELF
jgi:hypothetical protein